ncbi:MAG TPA: C39 family peptidase [Herpetosiphonaceae bacterium]
MGRRLRMLAGLFVLAGLALAPASSTFAGEGKGNHVGTYIGNDAGQVSADGSKIIPEADPVSAKQQRILERKQELSTEYRKVKQGKLDAKVHEQNYRRFLAEIGEDPHQQGAALAGGSGIGTMAAGYSSRTLSLTQVAQINSYYCGPASAYSILGALGKWTSYDGESLSQSMLATRKYLETDYWGNTPWSVGSSRPYPETLNYWRTGSYYGYYVAVGTTVNAATFKDNMTYDIDRNWPVGGNAWEVAGSQNPHLVGHPTNTDIFHWIAIYGYANWGDTTYYADPASGASSLGWTSVPRYAGISTNTLAVILDGRGYVW